MRKILAPVAIILLAVAPGAAFAENAMAAPVGTPAAPAATAPAAAAMPADQSIKGVVKAFDLKNHTLTLDNGIAYVLPTSFKDPGLKAGEKVTIMWHMDGKNYDATQVTIG